MFVFGDSFDLYAANTDAILGYWDGGTSGFTIAAGRFSGSQAIATLNPNVTQLFKNSGSNDAIHHIICAFYQVTGIGATNLGWSFEIGDGATVQCSVVFRSDGAILLTAGAHTGTVLATYAGAFSSATWTSFEFEIVVSNTVGGMRVRKNGNTSNDYDSFISVGNLDTAQTANNYGNRLTLFSTTSQSTLTQRLDDVLWRSDAASVPFVGDIRAYTRMPASDVSVQFARAPDPFPLTPNTAATTATLPAGNVRLVSFTPTVNGTLTSASISINAAATAHVKAAIYAADRSTVLATSSEITNPVAGGNVVTFTPGLAITKGAQYYFATDQDASVTYNGTNSMASTYTGTCAYASFPGAPITGMTSLAASPIFTLSFATPNHQMVSEAQQDGATSYVYDSTVGHSDLYGLAPLSVTPSTILAVTTRAFVQKSDAGTRSGAVQLKSASGGTIAVPTTWNPSDKTANITLSGGNLIATAAASGTNGVRSVASTSSGKYYWEVTWNVTGSGSDAVGIALATANLASTSGIDAITIYASGSAYGPAGTFLTGAFNAATAGMVMCFAYDATNRLLWVKSGVGAQWNGSGAADPVTGANGLTMNAGAVFAMVQTASSGTQTTANFGNTFVGTVPSGYTNRLGTTTPGTIVQSTSTALSTSWQWLFRTDTLDPATGAAWTPVAVNNVSVGPVVTA